MKLPSLNRPRAAGAAAVVGDRIVVVGGQADGPPGRDHRGVRRQAMERSGRTSRRRASTWRQPRTGSSSTRWADERCPPTRTPRRSSATTPRPTAGSGSPTCRPRAAASRPRSQRAICSRSAARPRRACWARWSPTTSARKAWSNAPSMRTPRHGITVAAIGRSLYCARGRTATRPRQRIGDRRGPQAHALSPAGSVAGPGPPGTASLSLPEGGVALHVERAVDEQHPCCCISLLSDGIATAFSGRRCLRRNDRSDAALPSTRCESSSRV